MVKGTEGYKMGEGIGWVEGDSGVSMHMLYSTYREVQIQTR